LLLVAMLFQTNAASQAASRVGPEGRTASQDAGDDPDALLKVNRIFVEDFGEDAISKEVQSMVVTSLVETKRFKVTENRERADALLKGVALEKSSQELHSYGETTAVRGAAIGDSAAHIETLNEAKVSLRLSTQMEM
jgi:curli biogenesis system outer membrane secretion channel CsgG